MQVRSTDSHLLYDDTVQLTVHDPDSSNSVSFPIAHNCGDRHLRHLLAAVYLDAAAGNVKRQHTLFAFVSALALALSVLLAMARPAHGPNSVN